MRERVDTSFYWIERLHSLMGVVPLGGFFLLYLFVLSFIFSGVDAFDRSLAVVRGLPLFTLLLVVLVGIPLILYVLMGLVLVYRSSANVVAYPTYRNWMYFLQRVSGIVGFAFVILHVWIMWIAPHIAGATVNYLYVKDQLSATWVTVFYLVGIAAIVFHLCNGLAGALISWGITQSRRSQFAAMIASWIAMIVLWFWSIRLFFEFV